MTWTLDAAFMDDLDGFAPIVDEAWYATNGQRRKTLVSTVLAAVLLLAFWFLLLVANAYVWPAPGGWLAWLPVVVGVGMWPAAVVIASRLVGLQGIGPGLVVAVGCLMLLALLFFGFVLVTAG